VDASQAPGLRVHEANTPFWDASGKRLCTIGWAWTRRRFMTAAALAIHSRWHLLSGAIDAKGSDLHAAPRSAKNVAAGALDTVARCAG